MKIKVKKDFFTLVFKDDKRNVETGNFKKSLAEAFEEINPPVLRMNWNYV